MGGHLAQNLVELLQCSIPGPIKRGEPVYLTTPASPNLRH